MNIYHRVNSIYFCITGFIIEPKDFCNDFTKKYQIKKSEGGDDSALTAENKSKGKNFRNTLVNHFISVVHLIIIVQSLYFLFP